MTVNSQEQKRLLMDLDVNMRSGSCPYTVTFYGALFREVSRYYPVSQCPWNFLLGRLLLQYQLVAATVPVSFS